MSSKRSERTTATTSQFEDLMYYFKTRVGVFSIVPHEDRWRIMFENESLGSYVNPMQAADDLAGGHTFSAGPGIDTAELGIPENLNEWSRRRPD